MKTIVKTAAKECLQTAKTNGWNWDDFHENAHDSYRSCRDQALQEQNDECAYTGLWLGEGTKQTVHIDHFRKKSLYPALTFDWNNLFAAAKDLDCGADFKDKSIKGPQTNSDKQYEGFFSPLEANLKEYFWYRQDGTIEPHPEVDDEKLLGKIINTIAIFNLNDGNLKNRRKEVIEFVRNLQQLEDDVVVECMRCSGFSFVTEFELEHRSKY